jgi:hypothetical protein
MQSKKLTPLEILHKQKADLQKRSDDLTESIENHAKYLQENFVPLLRDSVVESAVSKLPAHLQNLAGSFLQREQQTDTQNSTALKVVLGIAAGIAGIIPFFLKGKRGAILSILLKQIIKWVA